MYFLTTYTMPLVTKISNDRRIDKQCFYATETVTEMTK